MKKLIIKIGNETHELPYNGGMFSFEVSEKYVPKVGDCVKTIANDSGCANLFKTVSIDDDGNIRTESCVYLYKGKCTIDLDDFLFLTNREFTQITPKELKAKYAEAGYDWDYETNEVKPLKWMPKNGDECWELDIFLKPRLFVYDSSNSWNLKQLKKGLLFPTEAECQKFADHCLKYFDKK